MKLSKLTKYTLLFSFLVLSFGSFAENIKRGGVVTVTASKQGVLIKNFNPFSPKALHSTWGGFYEPLIFANEYTGEFTPWLAKSISWSKDLKSLTFELRQGIFWNDGESFDAKDVLFSVNLGKNNKALDRTGLWNQGLKNVRAINPYQIVFEFDQINTTILPAVGGLYIIPEHIWKEVDDPATWTGNIDPVGTGPFKLDIKSFSTQSYRLSRNKNYWQMGSDGKPLPYIDGIQYISSTGNAQGAMKIISGEVDWGAYFIANIDRIYVRRDPENNHYWLPEGNLVYLNLNNGKEPFNDVNVRRAVAMAIDAAEVTRIMNSGAVPAPQSGLKKGFYSWLTKSAEKHALRFDPQAAIKLLESVGYRRNGDNVMEKDGKALSFKLYVPTGWTDWVTAVDTLSTQLSKIGIEAQITQVSWPSPFLTNIRRGSYEISIDYVNSGFSSYYQYNNILPIRHWAPVGEDSATSHSHVRYKNMEVDKAITDFGKTDDKTKQMKFMDILLTAVMRDTPLVPLFFNPTWFEYSTRKFVGWPNENNPYTSPKTSRMGKMPVFLNIHLK